MTMKRLMLVWVMVMCLMTVCVRAGFVYGQW